MYSSIMCMGACMTTNIIILIASACWDVLTPFGFVRGTHIVHCRMEKAQLLLEPNSFKVIAFREMTSIML